MITVKKAIWITLGSIAGVFVLLAVIGGILAATGYKAPAAAPAARTATSAPATPTHTAAPVRHTSAPPPPVTNPKGSYRGACNYTLGSDPVGGTAVATGDISVHNTGNVGIVMRLKITWPQQGYAPLTMSRTVRLATGASRDVQFHRSITQTEIENLQNWQTSHNYADGCTYHGAITSTFGPVS